MFTLLNVSCLISRAPDRSLHVTMKAAAALGSLCRHNTFVIFGKTEMRGFFCVRNCELQKLWTDAKGRDPRDSSDGTAGALGENVKLCASAPSIQVRDLNVYLLVVPASRL